ncbi:MAG: lantibiotic dehydratase family protein, partial [Deltaproteobacteria bacterium]|nr:lantibiotic dehydratase family protein [Kofleriaceae bacterium]
MAAPKGIRAGDGIVLRTPLLPLTELPVWAAGGDEAAARRYLLDLITRPEVNEAIYVASPSLHAALESWRSAPTSAAGQRIEPAVAKYVARMMGRATPFGLFSGVSAGRLGPKTELVLAPRAEYRRRTRLDNDYLFLLLDELGRDPAVRARLGYRPNTSIYRSAGRLRYACARLQGTERSYHLVAVEPTPYLLATLERAASGAHLADLAAGLVDDEVTLDEAQAYIDQLVDSQLLVPELGVSVTGPEPIDGVLAQLAAPELEPVARVLSAVRGQIADLDRRLGNPVTVYADIAGALGALPAKIELGRLFQVDMVKPARAQVGMRIAADVATATTQLLRLARPASDLDEWKRQFRERWEDQMVPLGEALDEESGIGFETMRGPGSEGAPLLANLPFGGAAGEERVRWSRYEAHLARRLVRALAAGEDELVLDEADLAAMQSPASAPTLPDAFSVMFRLAGTAAELAAGSSRILFEGANGPSGAKLHGRFCHASPEIDAMVCAHHELEEAQRPDVVFAEIVHLNEGRIGNILCRPVMRGHELVYLGVSGAPAERQITIDDLLVGVRGDRVVLWSRRLDREVLPRLTTAHNFRLRSLCIYRFLCALAGQGTSGVGFSWGPLAGAPFLPRVRLGRVILERASWTLDEAELAPITA